MRNRGKFFIFYFLFLVFIWSLVFGHWSLSFADYLSGEALVQFRPGTVGMSIKTFSASPQAANIRPASVRALAEKFGVKKIARIFRATLRARPEQTELQDYYHITFPKEKSVEEVVRAFKKDPNVIHAQPNFFYRAFRVIPDDPHFKNGNQWGLTKIQADYAWEITTGTSEVKVAVIDTGIDFNHEDLKATGKIDRTNGWNFVSDNNNFADDQGHGTAVSGVIAAVTNNGVGIAGTDWHAVIMPLKALTPEGGGAGGDTKDIIDAIRWACTHGARVINMSLGQTSYDPFLDDACSRAYNAGLVIIAAAGNSGSDQKNYPAALDKVLAVAATNGNDQRSEWASFTSPGSNYGTWVDVSAPGSNIYVPNLGGGYVSMNGTSLACPFVAGLASLIISRNPQFSPAQIYNRIKATTDNIDSVNPGYVGKLGTGRINAYKALLGLTAQIATPSDGEYLKGIVEIRGTASGANFGSYILEASGEGSTMTIEAKSTSVESGVLGVWDTLTPNLNGRHSIRLKVFAADASSEEANVSVFVDNISPEVAISSPISGSTVEGAITVLGTAKDMYLDRYTLEYAPGPSFTNFQNIGTYYTSVDGGVLGTWETAGLIGDYILRLTAYDKAGAISSISVEVTILEVAPTKEVQPQAGLPLTFALPNPFDRTSTSETSFNYVLQGNFNTTVYMFDLNGNLIWRKSYAAGEEGGKSGANRPSWNGQNLYGESVPNGVYLYQVTADQKVIARGRIIVLN